MTETKNFALKLPEPTDMVDIGVLNENFQKIDEGLTGGYFDLDLRDVITFDLKNNSNADFALSANYADIIDIAALCEFVRAGKNIKLHIKTVEAGALADVTFETTVLLSNRKTTNGNVELFGPLYDSALTTYDRYQVELNVSSDDAVTLSYVDVKEFTGGGNAYYELDLRETVVLDIVDRTFNRKELSEEDTDLNALRIAANSGLDIRVQFKLNYWIGEVDANVILTSNSIARADDGAIQHINYSGCINGLLPDQTVYIVGLTVYNTNIYLSILRSGDSSVSEPAPTNTTVVKSDSTVTITTTLEGDKQSVTTITVDENDYPTKINTDGTEWPVTWEGF